MDYAELSKEEIIDVLTKKDQAVEDLTHQLSERESELTTAERNLRSTVDEKQIKQNK